MLKPLFLRTIAHKSQCLPWLYWDYFGVNINRSSCLTPEVSLHSLQCVCFIACSLSSDMFFCCELLFSFLHFLISKPSLFVVFFSLIFSYLFHIFFLSAISIQSLFLLSCFLFLLSCYHSSLHRPCFVRDKFVEVDLKPVCKHCFERLPDDMRRRLAKRERDSKEKKKKPLIPMCL